MDAEFRCLCHCCLLTGESALLVIGGGGVEHLNINNACLKKPTEYCPPEDKDERFGASDNQSAHLGDRGEGGVEHLNINNGCLKKPTKYCPPEDKDERFEQNSKREQ
jgi:hypothetical protein